MRKSSLRLVDWITTIIVLIGGFNWGLIAFFNFDVVARMFGVMAVLGYPIVKLIYGLVGISSLYVTIRGLLGKFMK